MIILVTGWRYSRESEYVAARLGELVGSFCLPAERIELVHGDCHLGGVDKHADTWGQAHAWKVTRFPASRYGSWPETLQVYGYLPFIYEVDR